MKNTIVTKKLATINDNITVGKNTRIVNAISRIIFLATHIFGYINLIFDILI
jgi:hypothetical protein